MLWHLVKKELLDNLLNKRFLVLLIISSIIAWSSVIILTQKYNSQRKDYFLQVNLQNDMINEYFSMNAWDGIVMMPPQPIPVLSSLVKSLPSALPYLASIDNNPIPILFPSMDIVFIIGIIMSIVSMSLSFDCITGEKESGTLKLLLVNGMSRRNIIIGKWMGGIISISMILMITLLGSVLIAVTISNTPWKIPEVSSLLILFGLSFLYCAAYFSMGLYVSTKTLSSANSIIVVILVWVLTTLIIPTAPKYLAEMVYSKPSVAKIQYEVFVTLKQEEEEKISEIKRPYLSQGIKDEEVEKITKSEIDKIIIEYENKIEGMKQYAIRSSVIYEAITGLLHFFSPYSCFILSSTEVAGAGVANQIDFLNKSQIYVSESRKYLLKRMDEEKQKDPSFSNSTMFNIKDRPQFHYNEISISNRVVAALTHTVFIFFYVVIFFVLAWKVFIRYDVR